VRRRSHYPTVLALGNTLRKVQQAGEKTQLLAEQLRDRLRQIREHCPQ
jgi:hypothetical protein